MISCLSPSEVAAGAPVTLSIFGHHLATAAGANAIVTIASMASGAMATLNGVPVTACHLQVQIAASDIPSARQAPVVVSPGGFVAHSDPVTLTVR